MNTGFLCCNNLPFGNTKQHLETHPPASWSVRLSVRAPVHCRLSAARLSTCLSSLPSPTCIVAPALRSVGSRRRPVAVLVGRAVSLFARDEGRGTRDGRDWEWGTGNRRRGTKDNGQGTSGGGDGDETLGAGDGRRATGTGDGGQRGNGGRGTGTGEGRTGEQRTEDGRRDGGDDRRRATRDRGRRTGQGRTTGTGDGRRGRRRATGRRATRDGRGGTRDRERGDGDK